MYDLFDLLMSFTNCGIKKFIQGFLKRDEDDSEKGAVDYTQNLLEKYASVDSVVNLGKLLFQNFEGRTLC